PDARPANHGWLDWLRRELAPSHERKVRTLILICGAVLCVIISTVLQVPELGLSAYMIFFISKENKRVTTIVGVLGMIGVTIGIAVSLLLYKLTYGHPEWRIPSMAIFLFLGMFLSRVLVLGPLVFLLGFVIAVTQSIGELVPSPERLVRTILWIWVAIAYGVVLTVVLNRLFLPKPAGPPKPLPKGLFVPDAFTNPAHVRFALKVTLAAMFCYFFYTGVDWFGIHTAFITCIFIALETTGATLYKGILRALGCIIGGLLALFSILVLIPHMETLASLVILVACVSAIAGWVATGTERIAYAGLQIAFAFFYSLFPGFQPYAPDIDLTNVRDRVFGILFGLIVMTLVFQYIWPERAMDRLREILREALGQLARLLVIPSPGTSVNVARPKAEALIAEISRELEKARRQAELTSFEPDEPRPRESVSSALLETILSRAEHVLTLATSLNSDSGWQEWHRLPPEAQAAESELRNAVARQFKRAANGDGATDAGTNLPIAFARWEETVQRMSLAGSRITRVSQIAAEAQHLGG
ncbi:MAG: putative rane protein, partial [Pedosphaera sp.]|nr:putative rane protein [Pedosphaera sp.]